MMVTRVTAVSISLLLPNWYFYLVLFRDNFFILSDNTHTRGHPFKLLKTPLVPIF